MLPVPQQEQAHEACLLLTVPLGRGMERAEDPPLFQGSKWPGQKGGFAGRVPCPVEPVLTKGSKCLTLAHFPSLMLTAGHPLPGPGCHPTGGRGHSEVETQWLRLPWVQQGWGEGVLCFGSHCPEPLAWWCLCSFQGTPRTAPELLGARCWQMKSRHTRGLHKLSQSPCREATSFSQQTLRSPELLAKNSGRRQWGNSRAVGSRISQARWGGGHSACSPVRGLCWSKGTPTRAHGRAEVGGAF